MFSSPVASVAKIYIKVKFFSIIICLENINCCLIFSSPWPQNAVILPGNEVLFSLETASDYNEHNDKGLAYGFKCLVFGYDWPYFIGNSGLIHLEAELSFLGGMCAASLMKKELPLPVISGKFIAFYFEIYLPLIQTIWTILKN